MSSDFLIAMTIHEVLQTESLFDINSWVFKAEDFFEEGNHEKEFFITFLSHISFNWDTIIQLVSKRYERVVNDNNIFKLSILDNSKIFDIDTAAGIDTVLSIESVFYHLTFRVQEVKTSVSVILSSSSEHAYFIIF